MSIGPDIDNAGGMGPMVNTGSVGTLVAVTTAVVAVAATELVMVADARCSR